MSEQFLQSLPGSAAGVASGTGQDVVITLAATPGIAHVIPGLAWSYSAAPEGGGLTISDSGVNVIDLDITVDGPNRLQLDPHLRSAVGAAMVITLKSGGAGITGKVNIVPAPYTQGVAA